MIAFNDVEVQMLQKSPAIRANSLEGHIAFDDPADCARWARYFNVPTEQLRDAVMVVGTNGDEVRRFLGKPSNFT